MSLFPWNSMYNLETETMAYPYYSKSFCNMDIYIEMKYCIREHFLCLAIDAYCVVKTLICSIYRNRSLDRGDPSRAAPRWLVRLDELFLQSIRQRGRKVAEHNWWLHTSRGDNDRRRAQKKSTAAAMIFLFYQSLLLRVIYRGSTRYFAVELELTFMGHISGSTALRVVPFQLRSQWGAEMRLILSLTNAAINCA